LGKLPDHIHRVYLTVPDWAVEIFPAHEKKKYLWQGKCKIKSIGFTDMNLDLELKHASGLLLHTSLSRRELSNLDHPINIGLNVDVGICSEGVHWVHE
jgi:hypothetical protein